MRIYYVETPLLCATTPMFTYQERVDLNGASLYSPYTQGIAAEPHQSQPRYGLVYDCK